MQSKLNNIVDYYDTCESDYRIFWDLNRSMAMHAGFWDHTTYSLSDALIRENEILAQFAKISLGDHVLDAGCGVGGSSFFLAKTCGCRVTGITLSDHQVKVASAYAKKQGLETFVRFEKMDFSHTNFPDASFDVIWGLESICHAEDKRAFVREAYRLLKDGGRLVIADGFASRSDYSVKEFADMRRWLNGWQVNYIETREVFFNHLSLNGFSEVDYRNITENIVPSSRRLYWISFPALVFSKLGEWCGVRKKIQTENVRAAYYQYVTLKQKLWEYGIFCAYKKSKKLS